MPFGFSAYCNHGDSCATHTFRDKAHLETLSVEMQGDLMDRFIFTPPEDRVQQKLTQCPPHIRKKYLRGLARMERMEMRKHNCQRVAASMQHIKFVFTDEQTWTNTLYADMSPEEHNAAKTAWMEAEEAEDEECSIEAQETSGVRLCQHTEDGAIRQRVKVFLLRELKWTHRDLHDALLSPALSVPARPSLMLQCLTLTIW